MRRAGQEQKKIFNDSYIDDPQTYAYVKISDESRVNTLAQGCSAKLIEHGMRSYHQNAIKFGLKFNQNYIPDSISHCVNSHVSSQINTHWIWKSHFFVRYMNLWRNY